MTSLRSVERSSSGEIEGGTIFDSIEEAEEVRDVLNSRYIDIGNEL
ncbi:MAG: hypothetical protein IIB07_09550 [Bacteroidetes bacterium]|nr:hypothetical protein [Bacteroidota bacterium]